MPWLSHNEIQAGGMISHPRQSPRGGLDILDG